MYSVSELVPHSGKMLLIDKVLDFGEEWLIAQIIIKKDSMFCENGSVPALVGIEYMAQSIAAFAGKNDKLEEKNPTIGLLLGSRKYVSNVEEFPIGITLIIHVEQIYFENGGLGVFKCKIESEQHEEVLIEANINVFHPEDISTLINSK